MSGRLFSYSLNCKKNATPSSRAGMRRTIAPPQARHIAKHQCALQLCFQIRPGGPALHYESRSPSGPMACYSSVSQSKMALSF